MSANPRPYVLQCSWDMPGFPEFHGRLRTGDEQAEFDSADADDLRESSQGEILGTVLQSDIDKIKMTMEEVCAESFEQAVNTILGARTIYIVGIRSCAPLASFLAFIFI